MRVIKRTGESVKFDGNKISEAVRKAFIEVDGKLTDYAIYKSNEIATYVGSLKKRRMSVEDIQVEVIKKLMASKRKDVAIAYTEYRYKRNLARQINTTDESVIELLNGTSDYWNNENSNKDSKNVTVQRDYLAGITSTDISRRFLLPEDVVKAHDAGIIHFHDMDYFGQKVLSNCSLCNLEDMLQNGTVINGVMIEKPHRLITATTIATQIITAVTSSQYGGVSISLTHLAPFVRDSYERYYQKYIDRKCTKKKAKEWAMIDLKKEVEDSVQTFNYQCNSMSTTNGQTPFLSVFMYLGETDEYKEELAMLIEEFLKQRILGIKNKVGVYVTPAFPKLLYVLEEDNVHEDSKYYYLTELAAKCTAKRMVPDYISEKKMKEYKVDANGDGHCYPCMGCVDGSEVVVYKVNGQIYTESIEKMWNRLAFYNKIRMQPNNKDYYIETPSVEIYDNKEGFVKNYRIVKNHNSEWLNIKFSNGRSIKCTKDHPFETSNGVILAKDLTQDDEILADYYSNFSENNIMYNIDRAWLDGFMICDGCYSTQIVASIAYSNEDDIEARFVNIVKNEYGIDVNVVRRERGIRGMYKDLKLISDFDQCQVLRQHMLSSFGGYEKKKRHIPSEVFHYDTASRLAFLAGMIDADGYVNWKKHFTVVQIGSVNKELALGQLMLAQSLGYKAYLYQNKYNRKDRSRIRYLVEFECDQKLIDNLASEKKRSKYAEPNKKNKTIKNSSIIHIMSSEEVYEEGFSYDVTTESEHFMVSGIYSHNCRSFLTPYLDKDGKPKYYGRLNIGVVTLSLPDLALSSGGNEKKFWELFEERTELCHKALRCRYERFIGVKANVAPIVWEYGAFGRLNPEDDITKLIDNGYATVSLGYAGLYECVKYMTGESHTDYGVGHEFGLKVMQALNDKCEQWKAEENLAYSIYGTPIESTTYKFATKLKERFGKNVFKKLDGHDRNYITNSYHCAVFEELDPFEKLYIESEFQRLSPGGAVSYVECSDMNSNIQAVLSVIKFIYDNIMYAELNTKSDYCQVCGYDGEIKIIEENGKHVWECPNCGNRDQNKMNVARRTCGYIGSQFWNEGRTNEISERFEHLSDINVDVIGEDIKK